MWHSTDGGEQPTAGAFPPLVIEGWRLQNGVAKWGTMSDTSQGEGWWLAGDGKWYPPEKAAPPPLATSTDAPLTRHTSVNLSQEASQDDAPSEQVSTGGASSTADPGASPRPRLRRHHRGKRRSRTPTLALSHYLKSRSSGRVRQRSPFLSPSSQPSRRVATTPPSQRLQRHHGFNWIRRLDKSSGSTKGAGRRRAAVRRAIRGKRRQPSHLSCRLAAQSHSRTKVLASMPSL